MDRSSEENLERGRKGIGAQAVAAHSRIGVRICRKMGKGRR